MNRGGAVGELGWTSLETTVVEPMPTDATAHAARSHNAVNGTIRSAMQAGLIGDACACKSEPVNAVNSMTAEMACRAQAARSLRGSAPAIIRHISEYCSPNLTYIVKLKRLARYRKFFLYPDAA